jgi:K+-sensing histidine kinase KdpD
MQKDRKKKLKILWQEIKLFNLFDACRKNMPKNEALIPLLGFFVMLSTFFNVNNMSGYLQEQNMFLVDALYLITLCFSSLLISYLLWPNRWKESNLISIIWNLTIVIVLICCSFLLMLLSDFSEIQLTVFMINIIVISTLCKWRWSLFSIISGVIITLLYYNFCLKYYHVKGEFSSLEFKVIYLLLLISGTLVVFLKPKQDQQEETEAKVDILGQEVTHLETEVTDLNHKVTHYSERISDQEREIERLGATAQKILNNVNHELRLPVGNVMNFAEMLNEGLGKYDESQLKLLSEEVYKNSNRLSSMIMNMLDLAALNAKKLELDKKTINMSELVIDRIDSCRKMYLDGKKIDFILEIQPEILISIDANYLRQVVDNLVINAIKFSSEGEIKISLLQKEDHVKFVISDNGIGMPQ